MTDRSSSSSSTRLLPLGDNSLLCAILATCGSFYMGYQLAFSSVHEDGVIRHTGISQLRVSFMFSTLCFGAPVGAMLAGSACDAFGRKPVIALTALLSIPSALLFAYASTLPVLIAARIICGIATGIGSVTAPLYVAEIAPPKRRGFLGSLVQYMIISGILVVQLLGYFGTLSPDDVPPAGAPSPTNNEDIDSSKDTFYKKAMLLSIIPAAIHSVGIYFLAPESPPYLSKKGRFAEAREALSLLLPLSDDIDAALALLIDDSASTGGSTVTKMPTSTERDSTLIEPTASSCSSVPDFETALEEEEKHRLVVEDDEDREDEHGDDDDVYDTIDHDDGSDVDGDDKVNVFEGDDDDEGHEEDDSSDFDDDDEEADSAGARRRQHVRHSRKKKGRKGRNGPGLKEVLRRARKPVSLSVFLMLLQQFCGITAVVMFTSSLFKTKAEDDAHITTNRAVTGVILLGACAVAGCTVYILTINCCGRRGWLLLSSVSVASTLFLGAAAYHFSWGHAFVVCIFCLYMFSFNIGLGPAVWSVCGELQPQYARATATSIFTVTNWVGAFIMSSTYGVVTRILGESAVFVLFGAITTLGVFVTYAFVPETAGRSIADIDAMWENAESENSVYNPLLGERYRGISDVSPLSHDAQGTE